ncbi:MAG: phosphodiesterase [Candidatus Latescibacteria bacterium]|nr:phosphodiesterase [Candidatus Latescibacterota bacterium]
MSRRVLIIGLDCAPPELIFDRFKNDLPTIRALVETGLYGKLKSTIPAITVPAWMSMVTSKDPGTLGFYGLRNRANYSYDQMDIANSRLLKDDTLWDILSAHDKKVILVGVPQTYPPRPVNGCLVASFLTPSTDSDYTYPIALKGEIEQVADGYMIDVRDFRTNDKPRLLQQIYAMTEKRFKVTRHLMQTREWDFCMHVEMGTDRIHHGFWRYLDETHRKHDPNSEYVHAIRDYYKYLDGEIASLMELAGPETAVLLVSDHGAKRIDGGICINEWLIQKGYLTLKNAPENITSFEDLEVDWSKTQAWGAGGYYARIFLNVKGREPNGVIAPTEAEAFRNTLAEQLITIPDPEGNALATQVFKPEETYQNINNIPPDLIVYFGDLLWRSIGSVGHKAIHTLENDIGPDDANHAQHGIFVLNDGKHQAHQPNLDIRDVAPSVLTLLDLPVPSDMQGRSVLGAHTTHHTDQTIPTEASTDDVYSEDEKKALEDRLKSLGYL